MNTYLFGGGLKRREPELESEPEPESPGGRLEACNMISVNNNGIAEGDENILIEILIRVPAKCANRYKCVSKSWYFMISHPYFVRRFIHHHHINNNNNNQSIKNSPFSPSKTAVILLLFSSLKLNALHITSADLDTKTTPICNKFSLSFLPCDLPRVVASCNDLLLCCPGQPEFEFKKLEKVVYYVCNPFTMQWAEVPPAPLHFSDKYLFGFDFVYCDDSSTFEEEEEQALKGKYYKYVIVRIHDFQPIRVNNFGMKYKLEIFSSQTNEWRESFVTCEPPRYFNGTNGVVCNHIMYWLCTHYVFAFDPYENQDVHVDENYEDDRRHRIDFPFDNDHPIWKTRRCLGVCQGRLRLWNLTLDEERHTLSLWELQAEEEDDKTSTTNTDRGSKFWCLKYKVLLKDMTFVGTPGLVNFLKHRCSSWLISCHPHDDNILCVHLSSGTLLFDIHCMTVKRARFSSLENITFSPDYVFPLMVPLWPTPVNPLLQNALRS